MRIAIAATRLLYLMLKLPLSEPVAGRLARPVRAGAP